MHRATHKNEYYNIFINYIPSIVSIYKIKTKPPPKWYTINDEKNSELVKETKLKTKNYKTIFRMYRNKIRKL